MPCAEKHYNKLMTIVLVNRLIPNQICADLTDSDAFALQTKNLNTLTSGVLIIFTLID